MSETNHPVDPNYPIGVLVGRCRFKVGDRVKQADEDGGGDVLTVRSVDLVEANMPVGGVSLSRAFERIWFWRITAVDGKGCVGYFHEYELVADEEGGS
jgi:hypothetical protein